MPLRLSGNPFQAGLIGHFISAWGKISSNLALNSSEMSGLLLRQIKGLCVMWTAFFSKFRIEVSFDYVVAPLNCMPLCVINQRDRKWNTVVNKGHPSMGIWANKKSIGSLRNWSQVWDGTMCDHTDKRQVCHSTSCKVVQSTVGPFFLAKDISELSSRKLLQVSVSPHYRAEM